MAAEGLLRALGLRPRALHAVLPRAVHHEVLADDRRGGPELGAPVDRDGAGHAEELPQAEAAAELAEVEHLMAGAGRMQRPVDPRGDVSIETVAAEKPCRICAMKGTAQDTV